MSRRTLKQELQDPTTTPSRLQEIYETYLASKNNSRGSYKEIEERAAKKKELLVLLAQNPNISWSLLNILIEKNDSDIVAFALENPTFDLYLLEDFERVNRISSSICSYGKPELLGLYLAQFTADNPRYLQTYQLNHLKYNNAFKTASTESMRALANMIITCIRTNSFSNADDVINSLFAFVSWAKETKPKNSVTFYEFCSVITEFLFNHIVSLDTFFSFKQAAHVRNED